MMKISTPMSQQKYVFSLRVIITVAYFGCFGLRLLGDSLWSESLLKKAAAGNAQAQVQVGEAYLGGNGVAKDYHQAHIWLTRAATQNNIEAKSMLGWLYTNGFDVPQDDVEAFKWYLAGAREGDGYGQLQVGECYAEGRGVTKDYSQATDWLSQSANQGSPIAQNRMGLAYLNGIGVSKDTRQAFNYFLHAAYHNYGPGQYSVALCYWHGVYVSRDPVQAYKWCRLATQNYRDEGADGLLYSLIKTLTGDQLDQGDTLVDDWAREQYGDAQQSPLHAIFMANKRAKMRFTWIRNSVFITVSVNNSDKLNFLFDTGAPSSALDEKTAATLRLKSGPTYMPISGVGHELLLGPRVDNIKLSVPGLKLEGVSLTIIDTSSWDKSSGIHIDGLLGYDILKHYVVEMDYVSQTVEIIDPSDFKPQDAGTMLSLDMENSKACLKATISKNGVESSSGQFMLDTGNSDSIDVSPQFLSSNPMLSFSNGVTSEIIGIGGVAQKTIVKCSRVQLGDIALNDATANLVQQNQGLWSANKGGGIIGNEILRRFDVTIDFPQNRIFLKKNSHFDDPYSDAPIPAFKANTKLEWVPALWTIVLGLIIILGVALWRLASSKKIQK